MLTFPKLVQDHRDLLAVVGGQDIVQQGGLARAEVPGDDRDRDLGGGKRGRGLLLDRHQFRLLVGTLAPLGNLIDGRCAH